jgi:[protein-PII] uridylyltransferase
MTESKRHRRIINRALLYEEISILRADALTDSERRKAVLNKLRFALNLGQKEVRTQFDRAKSSGKRAGENLTFLFDQLIRISHDIAEEEYPSANPTSADRLSIVAVGGYGRRELAPFSDIDLLFLFPYKQTPRGEQVVEYVLYLLWDLGIKIGHSTRSTDDCVRLARQDLTIRTALLEARYLWGDQELFLSFRKSFQNRVVAGSALEFVEGKLAERDARHKKLGDSRYLVEPNVKDGKGGLRDLQTLFWIAKYTYQASTVGDLVSHGVLSELESKNFAKDHNFLWTVRFHLHYLAERSEDRLTFDLQTKLAKRMNYSDRAGASGVERFMKHYYLVAKDIGDLTRIFCASIEADSVRKPFIKLPRFGLPRDLKGFSLYRDRLTVSDDKMFERDPLAMIRLFYVGQQQGLDIHPYALRLMTQNLRKLDSKLQKDPEANRLFIEIMTSPDEPEIALTRMSEAGVLGRFLPDFGRVVGQTQHDMYHVYTVDEHTIQAIGLLASIERGERRKEHPLVSEVLPMVGSRKALYVSVLLHDIAKGRGGNHSEIGAQVAKKICPRLGLNSEETETVEWLVKQHLALSNVAQKRDLSDSKTISDFANLVQSLERLRLLLCLTVVDMRATGPTVWNNWKAELLRELYYSTADVLSGSQLNHTDSRRVDIAKTSLHACLSDWPDKDVEAQLSRGYPGYWLTFDTDTLERQAHLMRSAEVSGELLSIDSRVVNDLDVTEVTIYTQDHPGLFSLIAGAFAAVGASVVDAKVFTTPQGMALDVFRLQDFNERAFDEPLALDRMALQIERSIAGEMKLDETQAEHIFVAARTRVFTVAPRVIIDNQASATHTVIEINGRDRPGFLFSVTQALYSLSLQISSSKISTYGERAVDVFYVKDGFGMKVTHKDRALKIRKELLKAIDDSADGNPPQKAAAE